MARKSLREQALALAARVHKLVDPLVLDEQQVHDPQRGAALHRFRVASAATANAASYLLLFSDDGTAVETTVERAALFETSPVAGLAVPVPATAPTAGPAAPAGLAPDITISPATNTLTLTPGQVLDETLTVSIPARGGSARADVYLLADTTGSMGGVLNAVKAGGNTLLSALNGLGLDLVVGVGNYKDFASGDPYAFQHQVSPTATAAAVTAGIGAWSASGGLDLPEAALHALHRLAVPPGGPIGWRSSSKRIVVWFGDAPSHEPICPALTGLAAPVTEASVLAALQAEGVTVLAISTATPGLDGDPKAGATGYVTSCGAPGGTAGQATRIATGTGGQFVTGINPATIVSTIVSLVGGAVAGIANVKLAPSASVAPFITRVTPAAGYGPLAGDQSHTLRFEVRFTGLPCKPQVQVVTGSIDVVVDGTTVAAKQVQITVPPCASRGVVYAVKFVCGTQPGCDCHCGPLQPGRYATEINVHNPTAKPVTIIERFVPLVLAGAAAGRAPAVVGPRAEGKIELPPHAATMLDCCAIVERLLGAPAGGDGVVTLGFVELTASAEIAVTAVYTTSAGPTVPGSPPAPSAVGVSIAIERIAAQRPVN